MITKLLEVRDRATFIPCIAIEYDPDEIRSEADQYLLNRAGYGPTRCILFGRLDGKGKLLYDPFEYDSRTMRTAHEFLIEHWVTVDSGDVIDVEFLLGEKSDIKKSERFE